MHKVCGNGERCTEYGFNIGNARIAGLEADLGMSGYDFNILLSVFYVGYIVFELPSTMFCKWIGPGWYLPATTVGFGVMSLSTGFVQNMAQACGVRFVLAIFEAGVFPAIVYYMSRWYRRAELALRLSLFIVMAPLAGAFGGLLASAILSLDSLGSLRDWRVLFVVEGIITVGLGLISFATVTDRPETARWLSAEEKALAASRIKAERIGTTEVIDKTNRIKTYRGIFSPVTLATAWIFLLNNITAGGLAFFLPTIVRTIYPEETVVSQQLHTVPPYIVGAVFVVGWPYLSRRLDQRNIIMVGTAPMTMLGYILFLASTKSSVRYGATFVIAASVFHYGALCNAQVSANVVSDTARSSAIATNVMIGYIGGMVATWSYLPFDGPNFPIGNGLNLAGSSTIFVCGTLLGVWMRMDNKRRDQKDVDAELDGLSNKQVQDLDWRHPGFRWKP